MTTNQVKNAVLRYFRFVRQYTYVATEVWNCDVIASDGKILVEVEVKVSWADYKREFKKWKHQSVDFAGLLNFPSKHEPNYKYFAAPRDLAIRIADDLNDHHQHYGVISVDNYISLFYTRDKGEYEKEIIESAVIKRAKKLHENHTGEQSLMDIVKRISSELITMREQHRV